MEKKTSKAKSTIKAASTKKKTPLTKAQLVRLKKLPAGFPVTICKNQAIPDGWVITSETSTISCNGDFPNAWTIERPGPFTTICRVSPIPNGYKVTGTGSSATCPGSFPNTVTIQPI
jgi:hypothetical protein